MRVTSEIIALPFFLNLNLDEEGDIRHLQHYHPKPQLREARRLQEELKSILFPIVAPERQLSREEAYEELGELINRINRRGVRPKWWVFPSTHDAANKTATSVNNKAVGKSREHYLVGFPTRQVKLLGYSWAISLDFDETSSLGDIFYEFIIDALRMDELSWLKLCRECYQFFIQSDSRQRFCSERCRIEFNNKQRLGSAYFSERRRKQRKRDLNKARKLFRVGKSLEEVSAETKLSSRVLKREGLLK